MFVFICYNRLAHSGLREKLLMLIWRMAGFIYHAKSVTRSYPKKNNNSTVRSARKMIFLEISGIQVIFNTKYEKYLLKYD